MASPSLVAAFIVLVPGMFAVGYVLRRFEGYFEQARLFFAIFTGLFAGIVLRALEVYLFPFDDPPRLYDFPASYSQGQLVYAFAYTTAGFALLAGAAMAMVLGLRKFRGRKDTPYYGTALGLVSGAMWAVFFVALRLRPFVEAGVQVTGVALVQYVALLAYSIGVVLAHGAAGAWAGKGVAEGKLWRGMMLATLWLMPLMALHWVYAFLGTPVLALLILGLGLAWIALATRRVLDRIVPAQVRDQVRKERRRAQRRGE